MYCCVNCFRDDEIVSIIKSQNKKGTCDFCKSQKSYIYSITENSTLSDMFSELLDVYTPISSLPIDFPKENIDLLKNILRDKWSIFNLESDNIYKLITAICSEKYEEQSDLFDTPIGILESNDEDYLKEFSIIGSYKWSDFTEDIKCKNRFHTEHINKEVLDLFIRGAEKTYKQKEVFYRARICSNEKGFEKKDMWAPKPTLATTGRVNPFGISVLYLSDSPKTILYEIRAGLLDFVTIGHFKLKKEIKIIDFTSLDKISPFIASNSMGIPYLQYAINMEPLKLMSQEIARPLRRHDSTLDYIPTQYISDYIKSLKYNGVKYISTMFKDGYNLAVFDENVFTCSKIEVHDITSLEYHSNKVK